MTSEDADKVLRGMGVDLETWEAESLALERGRVRGFSGALEPLALLQIVSELLDSNAVLEGDEVVKKISEVAIKVAQDFSSALLSPDF